MPQFHSPLTAADLWTVAPAFAPNGVNKDTPERALFFLSLADDQIDRDAFGRNADLATIYLACHFLDLDQQEQAAPTPGSAAASQQNASRVLGPVSSETNGPFSKSFSASVSGTAAFTRGGDNAFSDEMLATTRYGQKFVELRSRTFPARF